MSDITKGKTVEHYEGGGNKIVYINLGQVCNQKCSFCVIEGNEEKFPYMKTEEVKENIAGFAESGGETIMFTGGEPSMRNDLPEIIAYAETFPGIIDLCILTNATFFDDKKIEDVLAADTRKILSFSVSLHANTPEISKKLTNGADEDFGKTVTAIKELSERADKVTVYHIITSANYDKLPDFVDFMIKEAPKVQHFVLSYPFTQGAAEKNDWIYAKFSQLKPYLLKALEMIKISGRTVDISTCGQFPLCVIPGYEADILRIMDYFSGSLMGTLGGKVFHEFEWADKKWVDVYKNKTEACEKCLIGDVCQGSWKKYIDLFGFDGIETVTKENFKGNIVETENILSEDDVLLVKSGLKQDILNSIIISGEISKERFEEIKEYALANHFFISLHKSEPSPVHEEKITDNLKPMVPTFEENHIREQIDRLDKKEVEEVYDVVREIARLTGVSWAEVFAAYYGLKPSMAEANTGVFDEDTARRFSEASKLCQSIGMTFATSTHKYIINSPKLIFKETSLDDPQPGNVIVGISRDPKKAVSAVAHYHLKTMDSKYGRSFGELMGYPSCCLDFGDYLTNNKSDPNNFGFKNAAFETLKRSDEIAWQLNVFSTASFLSHFSCSFTCKESIAYIDNFLRLVSIVDPEGARETIHQLKDFASLYWTCVDKVSLIGDYTRKDKWFREAEVVYDNKTLGWGAGSANYYQENDDDFLQKIEMAKAAIADGDRIITTAGEVMILSGKDELLKFKKDNDFVPLLVKPTI